jgi:glyoxylase-like metal-dependent hydrolase (beta-lactamase superfamily II)
MYNIQNFKDPVEILAENGINPDEITDIIITHHHFDHIGSVHRFKNSNIYIQKDEFNAFFKLRGLQEIKNFLKNNNRVIKFQDSINLYDSITVENIGGHSIGSSVVFLKHNNIEFCFTGDEVLYSRNIEDKIGIGAVYNNKKNMEFINRISQGNYRILNFHEPDFNNFDANFVQVYP